MVKTAVAAAIVAALTLASCATYGDKGAVSSLRFNYVTEGGKAIGLVRAFDDGQVDVTLGVGGHAGRSRPRVAEIACH